MLLKRYMALGVREVFDDGADEDVPEVSPEMHQTCHHWTFEVTRTVCEDCGRDRCRENRTKKPFKSSNGSRNS